jgi:hypothetical protein
MFILLERPFTVIVSAKPRFRGVVGGKQRVKKITVTLAPGEHH